MGLPVEEREPVKGKMAPTTNSLIPSPLFEEDGEVGDDEEGS